MKPIPNGTRFTRLVVIADLGMKREKNGKNRHYYRCMCDCGNVFEVRGDLLNSGNNKSCGCLQFDPKHIKHGLTGTKPYMVWANMKDRCNNPKNANYHNYGGRGIKVCKEWIESFESFYEWLMNNGYKEGLSIDRVNVNGNYEPSNCKLITQAEQMLNTRRNVFYTYNGKRQTIKEWADEWGVDYMFVYNRLQISGKTMQQTFEESVETISKESTFPIGTEMEAVNS